MPQAASTDHSNSSISASCSSCEIVCSLGAAATGIRGASGNGASNGKDAVSNPCIDGCDGSIAGGRGSGLGFGITGGGGGKGFGCGITGVGGVVGAGVVGGGVVGAGVVGAGVVGGGVVGGGVVGACSWFC
jgi:hypothetical protein